MTLISYEIIWIVCVGSARSEKQLFALPPHPHPAAHTTESSLVISVFNMLNHPTYLLNQTVFWASIQPSKTPFQRASENTKATRLRVSFWSRSLTFWNQELTWGPGFLLPRSWIRFCVVEVEDVWKIAPIIVFMCHLIAVPRTSGAAAKPGYESWRKRPSFHRPHGLLTGWTRLIIMVMFRQPHPAPTPRQPEDPRLACQTSASVASVSGSSRVVTWNWTKLADTQVWLRVSNAEFVVGSRHACSNRLHGSPPLS